MRLSSRDLTGADRDAAMRELFGRNYLNIDIEFLSENEGLEAAAWQFPGVVVTSGTLAHARVDSYDAASQADIVMFGGGFGSAILRCRGREMISGAGEAAMFRGGDPMQSENLSGWSPRMIRIDAHLIDGLVPNLDDLMMRTVASNNQALKLLYQYLPLVCTPTIMNSPSTARAVGQHIVDLVVLAVGSTGDAELQASGRGMAAARSAQIRSWVARRIGNPALSLGDVAQAHRLSPRTIQEIFHAGDTSFSEFVLNARLEQANARLVDPLHDHLAISTIAFDVGFSDLSYFNRRFRQRYSDTPSTIRQSWRASAL